jgi:hypothetical protein
MSTLEGSLSVCLGWLRALVVLPDLPGSILLFKRAVHSGWTGVQTVFSMGRPVCIRRLVSALQTALL